MNLEASDRVHNRFKTILFTLFLWPISIGELSVNYSFVLFAAVSLFVAHKVYKPNEWVSVAAVIFSLIFLFSLPFTLLASGDQFLRATVSFAIFMTVFAFAITRIGMPEINSFRWALVVISCLFAGEALVGFLAAGGNAAGWELKNIVGSQRFGFIYILGFFVLLYFPARTAFLKLAKLGALSLILAGILLTFSRSSVIALSFAVGLYLLSSVIHRKNWSWRGLRIATTGALASVSLIAVAYMFFPVVFEFFSETILVRYGQFFAMIIPAELLSAGAPPPDDVLISKGSEGTRLVIWTAILQHTLENPILGSGYLGSWVLSNVTTGSAHNQYMDVLLRVGFLGFLVWILILYNVFRFLRRHHADLFWGGVGILIYGFFHETFKESQGAFILAFLVGMYVNHVRDCARSRNALLTQSDPVRLHTQATTHTAL